MQQQNRWTLVLLPLIIILAACQPIQPATPDAGGTVPPASAQPATIVLPDGTSCAWAGAGATLAFDGKRLNYTCEESDATIIGLLGDPVATEMARWTVEKATISHGTDGFTLQESEMVTFLLARLDLADGSQCAFAGEGATMTFDGKRLNYTCAAAGDTTIVGILSELNVGAAGVYLAEKVTIDRSGSEPTIQERAQVAVNQIQGAAADSSDGAGAMAENELSGTVWEWQRTQMNDDTIFTPEEPAKYTLTFLADGMVQMQADCNSGGGSYTLDGNQLTIGPVAMTLMACLPESLDSTFAQQLGEVRSYLMDEGNLVLELAVDSGGMIFAPAGAGMDEAAADDAARATLTGTVTYLQRIALLPGAVITVQLQDDMGVLIAEQSMTTSGENVPLPFKVTYDPAQIDEQGSYRLIATIAVEGQVRWTNAEPVAVLTNGAPTSAVEVLVRPVQ